MLELVEQGKIHQMDHAADRVGALGGPVAVDELERDLEVGAVVAAHGKDLRGVLDPDPVESGGFGGIACDGDRSQPTAGGEVVLIGHQRGDHDALAALAKGFHEVQSLASESADDRVGAPMAEVEEGDLILEEPTPDLDERKDGEQGSGEAGDPQDGRRSVGKGSLGLEELEGADEAILGAGADVLGKQAETLPAQAERQEGEDHQPRPSGELLHAQELEGRPGDETSLLKVTWRWCQDVHHLK